jgi:hypothetical protein
MLRAPQHEKHEPAMPLRLPIGIDDFRELRELGLTYIDKSHLLCELIDRAGTKVFLLPRPRRFGKSLNLSMLRCYLEKRAEDLSHLFEGLRVSQAEGDYRAHFQRYPVIHITFKDIKFESFDRCWEAIQKKIRELYHEHLYLLGGGLTEWQARDYRAVLGGAATHALYTGALADLSGHLYRHHGQKVVILIDEYDAPIHAGYAHGYAPQILELSRALLTGGLKDNPHLFKAVLTGVLRVAKESIFSGLNNLAVYSLLRAELGDCFGFTEQEVIGLLDQAGRRDRLEVIRSWYNGYDFGGTVVYNPWSVLNYLAHEESEPQPFWISTSSNDLIREILQARAPGMEPVFLSLLSGGGVERVLDENVALESLAQNDDALYSLLVFSGYLRAEKRSRGPMERPAHYLSIPNREVREVYTGTFREWMQARMTGHGGDLGRLKRALLGGDAELLEEQLQAFASNLLSYHDAGAADPEQLYHGFIVGLLAVLEPEHQVRSNRESGLGRPDVLIRPAKAGRPGVVLELKAAKPSRKTPEQALKEALDQIRENDYGSELRAAGASPVHAFAIAFDGKRVWVRLANE